MRFLAVKTGQQQAQGMTFYMLDLTVRRRTQTVSGRRGHPAEFGHVAPQGSAYVGELTAVIGEPDSGLLTGIREM